MKRIYSNNDFNTICARRSNRQTVILSKVLKDGKLGKPASYELYGSETSAKDVIARMERNNPGCKWVEA